MDKKDLKIQALLERVSKLTTESENRIADLRVELTIVTQEREELRARLVERGGGPDESTDDSD